jgi:hypothetical protein
MKILKVCKAPLIFQPSDTILKSNRFVQCNECGVWCLICHMDKFGIKSYEQIENEKERWLSNHLEKEHKIVTVI